MFDFLARHILRIPRFQIKIEHVFDFTSVLITLWHCHLQVQNLNLNQIIMMVIYWPNDPQQNCTNTFKF
jgi:hypothetical protein